MKKGIYEKANSILQLSGLEDQRNQILERLKNIYSLKSAISLDDPADLALRDLFGEQSAHDGGSTKFLLRDHVVEEMARIEVAEYRRYLRYRYAYEVYPQKFHVDLFPPLVQIEPTSVCNYRCVFCYQIDKRLSDKKNGHMGSMQLDMFKSIIDQIEKNVEAVTLASRGEPTVNKNLPAMLSYMNGKFLASKLNTNAYLLDEKLSHAILETNLQTLVFSADAASEPLYSEMRVNGNLERVLRNVERFHEIKAKHYPNSSLITRVSGVRYRSEQSLDEMERFWKRFVDQVAFVDYNPWENVYDADKNSIEKPCSDLWRRMFVWWDGRVAPCDVDYLTRLSSATLADGSISELWNGETYQALRASHLANERRLLEPCSRCVVV